VDEWHALSNKLNRQYSLHSEGDKDVRLYSNKFNASAGGGDFRQLLIFLVEYVFIQRTSLYLLCSF
jgi:hypothetical protein